MKMKSTPCDICGKLCASVLGVIAHKACKHTQQT